MAKRKPVPNEKLRASQKEHIRCIETGETFLNQPQLIRRANLDINPGTLRWRFHQYGKYVAPNGYTYIKETPKPEHQAIKKRAYADIDLPTSGWLKDNKLQLPEL